MQSQSPSLSVQHKTSFHSRALSPVKSIERLSLSLMTNALSLDSAKLD